MSSRWWTAFTTVSGVVGLVAFSVVVLGGCFTVVSGAIPGAEALAAEAHEASHPSPAYKYSRQANEAAAAQKHAAHHGHQHEGHFDDYHDLPQNHHPHPSHGHSHGHHEHGHHEHGHHEHGHGCNHQHDHAHFQEPPHHGHSHDAHSNGHQRSRKLGAALDTTTLWTQAIGATLLVSVAPFLILFFIPISSRSGHENFLKTLLSFASGGLLGDAFLHLIPHAMSPHDHHESGDSHHEHAHAHGGHGHSHDNSVGLCVLMGLLAFLIVEKFVRMVKGGHSHGDGHSHSSHEVKSGEVATSATSDDADSDDDDNGDGDDDEAKPKQQDKKLLAPEKRKKQKSQKLRAAGGDEPHSAKDLAQSRRDTADHNHAHGGSDIRVAAYLNLAADFAHNFTDGLAIGASFLAGNTAGIVSTVTILLHEVPHEIGDFAILIQSGMSKPKAMCMQLVTAIGCLSGTIVSLLAGGVGAANWVLPFTAGGFIYIATVSVIPDLLENTQFWQSVREIIALIVGVGMMMLLTEFEESV